MIAKEQENDLWSQNLFVIFTTTTLQPVWHGYLGCGLITVAVASEGFSSGSWTKNVMSSLWPLASCLGGHKNSTQYLQDSGVFNCPSFLQANYVATSTGESIDSPKRNIQKHIYLQTYKYFIYEIYKFLKRIIEFNPKNSTIIWWGLNRFSLNRRLSILMVGSPNRAQAAAEGCGGAWQNHGLLSRQTCHKWLSFLRPWV